MKIIIRSKFYLPNKKNIKKIFDLWTYPPESTRLNFLFLSMTPDMDDMDDKLLKSWPKLCRVLLHK